jgi:hypothetical protein
MHPLAQESSERLLNVSEVDDNFFRDECIRNCMEDTKLIVEEHFGCIVVRETESRIEHRWWFETTSANRLLLISEVVYYNSESHPELAAGRHYRKQDQSFVPSRVREALAQYGFDSHRLDTLVRYKGSGRQVPMERTDV